MKQKVDVGWGRRVTKYIHPLSCHTKTCSVMYEMSHIPKPYDIPISMQICPCKWNV